MQKAETLKTINSSVSPKERNVPFYLTLTYLCLEFGRPQASIPGLGALHLPAIVTIILGLSIIFSGKADFSTKQTKLFVLLLALMIFHIPIAVNNYWAFHFTKGMLITFVAYLGIITFVNTFQRYKTMINIWFYIHGYLAITGIRQGGRGIGGFLGDENDFCMTLNMIIPLAFFMAVSEVNRFKKAIYIGLIGLFLLANITTLSRGGFIGLVAVGIYCWLRSPKKIMSAVLISLLILFMIRFAPDKYWDEVKSIQQGTSDSTGEDRVYIWKIGWKMFLDNIVLGVGQGNLPYRFREYEIASGYDEGLHGRSRAGRAAHSLYFTLFPELGLVGTFIFLGMNYYILKDILFIRQSAIERLKGVAQTKEVDTLFHLSYAMVGSLMGFLVSGVFISILYYPSFWILMGFVVALRKVSYEENPPSH